MRRVLQTQGESGTADRAMAPILAIATPAGKPVPCTYMNPGGGRVDVLADSAVSARHAGSLHETRRAGQPARASVTLGYHEAAAVAMTEAEALAAIRGSDPALVARAEAALWQIWCHAGIPEVD